MLERDGKQRLQYEHRDEGYGERVAYGIQVSPEYLPITHQPVVYQYVSVIDRQPKAHEHAHGDEHQRKEHIDIRPLPPHEEQQERLDALRIEQRVERARHAFITLERIFYRRGLILVDYRVFDVHSLDLVLIESAHGELGIVGRCEAVPAVLFDDLRGEHHTRAAEHRALPDSRAEVARETAVADIPKPRYAGYDVLIDVFGVGVAARALDARVERIVHARYVIGLHEVVRVELDERLIVMIGVKLHYLLEKIFERIARFVVLGIGIEPLEDRRARIARKLRGVVRAVVRNDVHVEHVLRVFGRKYALYGIGNDRRFVARGNDYTETVLFLGDGVFLRPDEKQNYVNKLYSERYTDYR